MSLSQRLRFTFVSSKMFASWVRLLWCNLSSGLHNLSECSPLMLKPKINSLKRLYLRSKFSASQPFERLLRIRSHSKPIRILYLGPNWTELDETLNLRPLGLFRIVVLAVIKLHAMKPFPFSSKSKYKALISTAEFFSTKVKFECDTH